MSEKNKKREYENPIGLQTSIAVLTLIALVAIALGYGPSLSPEKADASTLLEKDVISVSPHLNYDDWDVFYGTTVSGETVLSLYVGEGYDMFEFWQESNTSNNTMKTGLTYDYLDRVYDVGDRPDTFSGAYVSSVVGGEWFIYGYNHARLR